MAVNTYLSHASYMQSLSIQSALWTIFLYVYAPELIMCEDRILIRLKTLFNTATVAARLLVHEPQLQIGKEGTLYYTQRECLKQVRGI